MEQKTKLDLLEAYAALYYVRRVMVAERNTFHRKRFWKLINRFHKPAMVHKADTMSKRIAQIDNELHILRNRIVCDI